MGELSFNWISILAESVFFFFFFRHGDRTRAGAPPCWDNDTAQWDCLLSSASIPVIKHDIHDITVSRLYRDGMYMYTYSYVILSDRLCRKVVKTWRDFHIKMTALGACQSFRSKTLKGTPQSQALKKKNILLQVFCQIVLAII